MLRKLIICPWFGFLPVWFDQYLANIELLRPYGYDWLITTNLGEFKKRVREKLGIECPIVRGTGKLWDYRACLGVLFEDEIRDGAYDYWGHADFDCVFGRIDHFMPDDRLSTLDIWSNHADPKELFGGYICGPWTLYRHHLECDDLVANLFMRYPDWAGVLEAHVATGWVEFQNGFTGVVDAAHNAGEINRLYTMYQTRDLNNFNTLKLDTDGTLYENGVEVMMAHFRRKKEWPLREAL